MKIVIASPIHKIAISKLRKSHRVVETFNGKSNLFVSEMKDAEAIVIRSGVSIDKTLLDSSLNLRIIIRAGSGVDNIDLLTVKDRDILFYRIPQPGARAVAELSFAMMLSLSRNLIKAHTLTSRGTWAKYELEGYHLHKKTLGIIGAGNIGTTVGELGIAWGMKVYGCVKNPNTKTKNRLAKLGIKLDEKNNILKNSDVVSVHVSLQESTINLIDQEELSLMKPSAILINLSRGGVVNEKALLNALNKGVIKAAALDVHDNEGEGHISPFANLNNVILTPHIGAQTVDAQKEIGEKIIEIINEYSKTKQDKSFNNPEINLHITQ